MVGKIGDEIIANTSDGSFLRKTALEAQFIFDGLQTPQDMTSVPEYLTLEILGRALETGKFDRKLGAKSTALNNACDVLMVNPEDREKFKKRFEDRTPLDIMVIASLVGDEKTKEAVNAVIVAELKEAGSLVNLGMPKEEPQTPEAWLKKFSNVETFIGNEYRRIDERRGTGKGESEDLAYLYQKALAKEANLGESRADKIFDKIAAGNLKVEEQRDSGSPLPRPGTPEMDPSTLSVKQRLAMFETKSSVDVKKPISPSIGSTGAVKSKGQSV